MNDHFGRELQVGDYCFHTNGTQSQHFTYCKVVGFTSKRVIVLNEDGETMIEAHSLTKATTDGLGDIVKREAIVVDIDGTFLREEGLYGKEVVNYDVLIEIKKHISQGRFVAFLTNRDRWIYYDETIQSIEFYLEDIKLYSDYQLFTNYFSETKNEQKHKESEIKNILKKYNVINWYEDNPAIQKIAEKYNIPFTLITE